MTYVCLASRWPDAVPLRTVTTAKAVARGMMEIMSRTGILLRLLTDRGPHFVGSLGKELRNLLHIDKVQTTAYHTKGYIEHMHSTIEGMLSKAKKDRIDWVD